MAYNDQNWDDLGRSIQDLVDRAVNSRDYQKLNQTIHQVVDRAVDVGSSAVRKVVDSSVSPRRTGSQPVKRLYGSVVAKTVQGIIQTFFGANLSFISAVTVLGSMMSGKLGWDFLFALSLLAVGGWLTYAGIRTLGMVTRFKTYRRILGQKTHCLLERLACSVGKSEKFVRADVQRMISKGYFLEGSLDKEERSLITSYETFALYEQSRLQLEERQRQEAAARAQEQQAAAGRDPQVQEILERGDAFISQIRKCNDDIPGEEISAKISRMELIVQRIFERAESNPEVVPDLKKLMDYYLPMTVKLLNAYADMDAQPVQGETIQASKQEIEATLDTLNVAFEKLLDSIFKDTAMDVSSDISVLNTLLAQEGLTEDDLSKMKKQQNP